VHRTLARLPSDFIQGKTAHPFADGVRDRELKQHLFMGSDRLLNKVLNRAMKLEVLKAAAVTPARLTMRGMTRVPVGTQLPPAECCRDGSVCWLCGKTGHLSRDCQQRPSKAVINNQDWRKDLITEGRASAEGDNSANTVIPFA
jgi:hypothetical protein